jgi:hypothetical protein
MTRASQAEHQRDPVIHPGGNPNQDVRIQRASRSAREPGRTVLSANAGNRYQRPSRLPPIARDVRDLDNRAPSCCCHLVDVTSYRRTRRVGGSAARCSGSGTFSVDRERDHCGKCRAPRSRPCEPRISKGKHDVEADACHARLLERSRDSRARSSAESAWSGSAPLDPAPGDRGFGCIGRGLNAGVPDVVELTASGSLHVARATPPVHFGAGRVRSWTVESGGLDDRYEEGLPPALSWSVG